MKHSVSTLVTAPTVDVVTLAEAKAWAKISSSDDDALLAQLITTATTDAEQYLKRSLITQTRKLTIDAGGSSMNDMLGAGTYDLPVSILCGGLPNSIKLPCGPLQTVTTVTTYDLNGTSSVYSSTNYFVDTASCRLVLNYAATWPSSLRPMKSCEITYVAGFGNASSDVPAPIKTAILMHIQSMYDARLVCDMPPACEKMLQRYRIYG